MRDGRCGEPQVVLEIRGWAGGDEAFALVETQISEYVVGAADSGLTWTEIQEDLSERHAAELDGIRILAQEMPCGRDLVLVVGEVAAEVPSGVSIRTEIRDWCGPMTEYRALDAEIHDFVKGSVSYGHSAGEIEEDLRSRWSSELSYVSVQVHVDHADVVHVDCIGAARARETES